MAAGALPQQVSALRLEKQPAARIPVQIRLPRPHPLQGRVPGRTSRRIDEYRDSPSRNIGNALVVFPLYNDTAPEAVRPVVR